MECDELTPQTCGEDGEWQSGAECTIVNGVAACTDGVCGFGSCNENYGNCDGNASNGCETNTNTSNAHCGACANACTGGNVCSGGTCVTATPPLSCVGGAPGQADCGPGNNESCCMSLPVPGGTVKLDDTHSATVSDFKLDKYEITVGRFRKFVDAWVGGWRPATGAGKHVHLNGGKGLSNGSGGYEPGWDKNWDGSLGTSKATWDSNLACQSTYQTWTSTAGANEKRPINCVNWYETAAFCIWDGGLLPSEAEWQYAAAEGSEGRQYPWSVPPGSTTIDCTYANYTGCGNSAKDVGSM